MIPLTLHRPRVVFGVSLYFSAMSSKLLLTPAGLS